MHVNQPPFLRLALLYTIEAQLVVNLIARLHLLKPLCKLVALLVALQLCFGGSAAASASSTPPSAKRRVSSVSEARIASAASLKVSCSSRHRVGGRRGGEPQKKSRREKRRRRVKPARVARFFRVLPIVTGRVAVTDANGHANVTSMPLNLASKFKSSESVSLASRTIASPECTD